MALLERTEPAEADHKEAEGLYTSSPHIQRENIEDKFWKFPESPWIHTWSNSEEDVLF